MRKNRSQAVTRRRGGNTDENWATRSSMARCRGSVCKVSGHWRYQVFHSNWAPVWSMRSTARRSHWQA